jgi:hypothetical protein
MVVCYSISELLSLRHGNPHDVRGPLAPNLTPRGKLYFSLWERYLKALRQGPRPVKPEYHTEYRYDFVLSNRAFKAQYVRLHGTTKGLSDLPKRKIIVLSRHVTFLERHIGYLRSLLRRIDNLRPKLHATGRGAKRTAFLPANRKGNGFRQSPSNPDGLGSRPRTEVVRPSRSSSTPLRVARLAGQYVDVLGGITFSSPPRQGTHQKYWYFYRKRNFWRFSTHHPYGDEFEVYRVVDR